MSRRMLVGAVIASVLMSVGPVSAHPGEHGTSVTAPSTGPRPASKNTVLIGHVNPGKGSNGDVFAFHGHAYLASWGGLGCLSKGVRVYDLAHPRDPRHVSTFADAASEPAVRGTWTEKVIVQHVRTGAFRGDLAVVSFQDCGAFGGIPGAFRGFGLYDVTDPSKPRRLALYPTGRRTGGSHEIWLEYARGHAYVYTAVILSELDTAPDRNTPGKPDFRIIDVSDPRHPTQVGGWGAWAELGLRPHPNNHTLRFVHSVRTDDQARRAYLSYWDLGTVILDISRPSHPVYLGRTPRGQGSAHSADVARGGRLLVETHERTGGIPTYYDISDPAHPKKLSNVTVPGYRHTSVHDPKIDGGRTYFSWYGKGVVVAKSARPSHPRVIAQFLPKSKYVNPDFFCNKPCVQVWGTFPYRGYVLASDMNSGLYIFKVRR